MHGFDNNVCLRLGCTSLGARDSAALNFEEEIMIRKLIMLFLLRAAYKHAHRIIDRADVRGSRTRGGLGRRKPAVKRRRAGWEF